MLVFCKSNSDCLFWKRFSIFYSLHRSRYAWHLFAILLSWFDFTKYLESWTGAIALNAFVLYSGPCSAVLHVLLELRQHSTDWLLFITRFSKCSAPITKQQIFRSGQPSAMVITVRAKFSKELGILPQIWSQAWVHSAFLQESPLRFLDSSTSVSHRAVQAGRYVVRVKVADKCLSPVVKIVCGACCARKGQKKKWESSYYKIIVRNKRNP